LTLIASMSAAMSPLEQVGIEKRVEPDRSFLSV
jgi:hypothetical protein